MKQSPLNQLAETLFPEIKTTVDDLEKRFPKRPLPAGAEVTRFAPSPTGFLHTGSLFTALVAKTYARQNKGVFFLRLEDTDKQREVVGSDLELILQMKAFGVEPDEGFMGDHEVGAYGPYRQSKRADIYKTVIKWMVQRDLAYPCFATVEELDALRKEQELKKELPGYYGKYATYRTLDPATAIEWIKAGKPYAMRYKSPGNHLHYIDIHDEIRGDLKLSENDQDIIILKGDGLPTYHFAHVVDDHFMRTTTVSRGEEWLSSLPIHLQIFASLKWTPPKFAHLPVINKLDQGAKRKLSKRKDPEAAVSFFLGEGYPVEAIKEYLMTIANSNYEEWRLKNPSLSRDQFTFSFSNMTLDGALFDLVKVAFISKEMIAKMKATELFEKSYAYAKVYDPLLLKRIEFNPSYYQKVLNVEREKPNPRKDFSRYKDIAPAIAYFYEDGYNDLMKVAPSFNPALSKAVVAAALDHVSKTLQLVGDESTWFNSFKTTALSLKFAPSNKEFKANPNAFIGHVGDLAELLRIALTGSKQSPSLFESMVVLGEKTVKDRLNRVIRSLKSGS